MAAVVTIFFLIIALGLLAAKTLPVKTLLLSYSGEQRDKHSPGFGIFIHTPTLAELGRYTRLLSWNGEDPHF